MYMQAIHWLMYLEFFYFSRYEQYAVFSMHNAVSVLQEVGVLSFKIKGIARLEKQKVCG